ncbi:MAG: hypothetical protein RH942_11170 [Kiloniellaceae bacterium]
MTRRVAAEVPGLAWDAGKAGTLGKVDLRGPPSEDRERLAEQRTTRAKDDGTRGMDFKKLNGVVLHYQDLGPAERRTLVFANSLGTDFRIWNEVVARLADSFRIVLYDKRGHGLSEIGASPYRISDHVADLVAPQVLDETSAQQADNSISHGSAPCVEKEVGEPNLNTGQALPVSAQLP